MSPESVVLAVLDGPLGATVLDVVLSSDIGVRFTEAPDPPSAVHALRDDNDAA